MNLEKLDYWIACQLDDTNERIKEKVKEGINIDAVKYLNGATYAYDPIRNQMTLVRYLEKE